VPPGSPVTASGIVPCQGPALLCTPGLPASQVRPVSTGAVPTSFQEYLLKLNNLRNLRTNVDFTGFTLNGLTFTLKPVAALGPPFCCGTSGPRPLACGLHLVPCSWWPCWRQGVGLWLLCRVLNGFQIWGAVLKEAKHSPHHMGAAEVGLKICSEPLLRV